VANVVKKVLAAVLTYLKRGVPTKVEQRNRLIARGRIGKIEVALPPRIVELASTPSGATGLSPHPSILVLALAHIGDFVLSLRALKKLRDGFPESRMTLVVAPWNADLARATGYFDRVVGFDFFPRLNKDWNGPSPDIFARFDALGLGEFEVAVDLRHDSDTRPCLFRANAKVRAGFWAPRQEGLPFLDLMLPHVENLVLTTGEEYSIHAELRLELLADAVVSAYGDRSLGHPVLALADASAARHALPMPSSRLARATPSAVGRRRGSPKSRKG
jgi:hypothetical protein